MTLIALFYAEEDLRGRLAWGKARRQAAAAGERLDYSAFIPQTVPDDDNFAMGPLLRLAFDFTHTPTGIRWRDTNAWDRARDIVYDKTPRGWGKKAPDTGDVDRGTLADLPAAADFYRGNTNYPQSASSNPAEVVLTALNKFEPDLKELREAAAARPYSRFPIEYNYDPPMAILLPHLVLIKGLVSVCELRAAAELDLHKTDDAFVDLQLAFRLSDSIQDEPFLVDQLVRLAGLSLTVQGIHEGIVRQAWSDAQLDAFQKYLENVDLLFGYQRAMRSELAFNLRGIEYYRDLGSRGIPLDGAANSGNTILNWMPSGWYDQNMVTIAEYYRGYILNAINQTNRIVKPKVIAEMDSDIANRRAGPYNVLGRMLMPAFSQASLHFARGQTLVDEARVACALDRYRLAHSEIPDSLTALVPRFLTQVPNDLFDGQPLRYKKTGPDAYFLYSIGWNQKDDGGEIVLGTGSAPRANAKAGDWVWQIPPPQAKTAAEYSAFHSAA
ncbi:MAG TPA: hypothetical protein VN873_18970 [Candidatus Angelobacter sp.]|nr:hypothetical protein [Candidatus Angelobacter sp.]